MKKLVSLLLLLCCITTVSATIIPVPVDVSVEFTGEREFTILLPNGFIRQFSWDQNKTHSDASFSHTIYTSINETQWCSDNSELNEYKKIAETMTGMLTTCNGVVAELNKTGDLKGQMYAVEKDRDMYKNMLEACDEDKLDARNRSEDCVTQLTTTQEEITQCESNLQSAQRSSQDASKIQDDLDEALSSKNTFAIGGVALGLVLGYVMWKKKKTGPSEHMEMGGGGDYVGGDENGPRY